MRWLRLKVLRDHRRRRGHIRKWLLAHPRLARFLERTGTLNVNEYTLARGVAVGLFIGLTPTVGIQTGMMIAASILFRANFPAAFVVSFVSNPFTMAPLYFGFNRLGEWILGWLPVPDFQAEGMPGEIAEGTLAMLVGSLFVAAPVTLVGYVAFLWLWHRLGLKVPRPRTPVPAETQADATSRPER